MALASEKCPQSLQLIAFLVVTGLYYENDSASGNIDVKLFCSVIYINQKHIIKKKILDKIISVKPLPICHNKLLHLKAYGLAYHRKDVAVSLGKNDILYPAIIPGQCKMHISVALGISSALQKHAYIPRVLLCL